MFSVLTQEYATKMMLLEERQEGKKEGIEEGEKKGKEETALKLLSMKLLSIEQIAAATNLSVEKIKELAKA